MKNYFKKVFHILPIFLLAVFLCVVFLAVSRFVFDFKYQIIDLSDNTWGIFLPMILAVLSMILIRKRFSVLKISKPGKDNFFYIFVCALLLCALIICSQFYYKAKISQTQIIQNVSQISFDRNINRIKIEKFFIDDSYQNDKFETGTTGKYGNKLKFSYYFITALLKDSVQVTQNNLPKVWFASKFTKIIYKNSSDKINNKEYKIFREKCFKDLEKYNYHTSDYFVKMSNSEEKQIYEKIILNTVNNPQSEEIIILSPSNGNINDDGQNVLLWFFKILGAGILLLMIILAFPNYNDDFERNTDEEDDFKFFLKAFIPTKDFFLTPILLDINILVFIILSFFGVNPFDVRPEVLVKFGALTSEFFNGEYWRIISSMFLHGGILHLVNNMIALTVLGFFSENIFGRKRFGLIYFSSGIIAGISSLLWHDGNVILVGASGAIFGILGAFTAAMILENNYKEHKVFLVIILIYFLINIFMGFFTNSDNAAHISGFISGFILALILNYLKK